MMQFIEKKFRLEQDNTIGVEFGSRFIKVKDKVLKLQIWDTAGQEQFRSITRSYYRNSICALLVYDVSDRTSFENITKWIDETNSYANDKVIKLLIGNKCDLSSKREVSYEKGKELASQHNMIFFEASAKTGENVELIFLKAAELVLELISTGTLEVTTEAFGVKIGPRALENSREIGPIRYEKCCRYL
eukprot:TRINITY_DN8687_c0_g1_i8.p1 TRINITY_DN8687_c0_g1~~TRINITY_DN8687_c0_g1_i8.p1  ORF type:complete len:189 (-),score=31.99 TRINITY_DN8687_c0_g1_i8:124-690(-)